MKNTIFIKKTSKEPIETVIGDEKQTDFYPRVKIKKWNNEVNFSVGVIDTPEKAIVTEKGDTIEWKKNNLVARFYPIPKKPKLKKATSIRYINEGVISPFRLTAEYELDRNLKWEQPTIRVHWSNVPAMLYYGFYPRADFIDPNLIDIPEVRMAPSPHWNDPMYMDDKLAIIDVHYNDQRDDLTKLNNSMIQAVAEIVESYSIKVINPRSGGKLYFEHDGKRVKFFSTAFIGGHYYFYINLDCDYNKSYKYYKKGKTTPRNDPYAYGLRTIKPDIPDSIIDDVIKRYATLYGLPLKEDKFSAEEEKIISRLEKIHKDSQWINNGKRFDPYKLTAGEDDEDGFEFEVDLPSKPASNVIPFSIKTKGLEFYYQGELTKEEITDGCNRLPRAIGSYAVYHTDKRNNQYGTGKAFHIYRPIVTDSNGEKVYGDIKIDFAKEILNVTIPQSFLDSAVYPVTVDPTFGYTSAGASYQSNLDYVLGTFQRGAVVGNVISMSMYVDGLLSTIEGAIYTYSNAKVAETSAWSGDTGGAMWMTLPFIEYDTSVTQSDYKLYSWGTTSDGGSYGGYINLYYDTLPGSSYSKAYAYTGTWENPITSLTAQNGRQYSIYVNYGYSFPIMAGSSTAMPVVTANRYTPIMAGNTAAWGTTAGQMNSVAPVATRIQNFKFVLATAPGGTVTRTVGPWIGDGVSAISVGITGASTSGSDTTNYIDMIQSELIEIGHTADAVPAASAWSRWRLLQIGANQILFSTGVSILDLAAARYMGIQYSYVLALGTGQAQVFPDSGTLQNLCVYMSGALTSGSYLVEVYKNGLATGFAVTLDSANQVASDNIHTVSVAPGDTLYIKITPSSPNIGRMIAVGMEYASNTPGNGVLLGGSNESLTGSTVFNNWYGGNWNATETNVQALGYAITITKLQVLLGTTTGASKTRTITFRKNGGDTPASVAITGGTTGTWTGSVTIATDDLICVAMSETNSPTASTVKYGITFTATSVMVRPFTLLGVG